jgi:hypothetical protein
LGLASPWFWSREKPLENELDNDLDEQVFAITALFDEGPRVGCSEFLGIENFWDDFQIHLNLHDWQSLGRNVTVKQCFEYSYFLDHIAHPPFLNSNINFTHHVQDCARKLVISYLRNFIPRFQNSLFRFSYLRGALDTMLSSCGCVCVFVR